MRGNADDTRDTVRNIRGIGLKGKDGSGMYRCISSNNGTSSKNAVITRDPCGDWLIKPLYRTLAIIPGSTIMTGGRILRKAANTAPARACDIDLAADVMQARE